MIHEQIGPEQYSRAETDPRIANAIVRYLLTLIGYLGGRRAGTLPDGRRWQLYIRHKAADSIYLLEVSDSAETPSK
jgi:hypothetical protein